MHLNGISRNDLPVSFIEQIHAVTFAGHHGVIVIVIQAFVRLVFHKELPEAADVGFQVFHRLHYVYIVAYPLHKLLAFLPAKPDRFSVFRID